MGPTELLRCLLSGICLTDQQLRIPLNKICKRIELKLSFMRYQNSQGFAILRYVLTTQVVVKIQICWLDIFKHQLRNLNNRIYQTSVLLLIITKLICYLCPFVSLISAITEPLIRETYQSGTGISKQKFPASLNGNWHRQRTICVSLHQSWLMALQRRPGRRKLEPVDWRRVNFSWNRVCCQSASPSSLTRLSFKLADSLSSACVSAGRMVIPFLNSWWI